MKECALVQWRHQMVEIYWFARSRQGKGLMGCLLLSLVNKTANSRRFGAESSSFSFNMTSRVILCFYAGKLRFR